MSEVAAKSTEELLAELRDQSPDPTPSLSGEVTLQAWMHEYGLEPGRAEGLEASDLYRHYRLWCDAQGHKPLHSTTLFKLLKRAGYYKLRTWHGGRELRPYAMNANSARYFKKWLEDNPTPVIDGRLPNSMKSNVRKALEELGVDDA